MKYEKTPVRMSIRKSAIAKRTTDINQLSTGRILWHVVRRNEVFLLALALGMLTGIAITS